MSAKPCPKSDHTGAACGRPKKKGKQACEWHWLARQSSDVQADAARARLEMERSAETLGQGDFFHRARVPKEEWPDGERWCSGCQSFVPLFYCSGSRCKACKSLAAHEKRLEATYGIDSAEYDRIFRLQGGRCAICQNKPASIRFAVDHDHKTGEVRGILCKRCNHDLLGGGHDSIDLLWRAIKYLLAPPARHHGPEASTERYLTALADHLAAQERREMTVSGLRHAARPEALPPPF